jgi:hypothetical protein
MIRRGLIFSASLLVIAALKADKTAAQIGPDPTLLTAPIVLAGPDVGFRVVRMDGAVPVGQIVVRINGAWIAAETSK